MRDTPTASPASSAPAASRRPYLPPHLVRYGAVRDLTQTGTGSQSESDDSSSSGMNCTSEFKLHMHCLM